MDEEIAEIAVMDREEADRMPVVDSQGVDSEVGLPEEVFQVAERPAVDLLEVASRVAALAVGHQEALAAFRPPTCCADLMRMVTA